ncbi:homoserine dehydrogenase [Candidatus Bathyarchaeota archaeon]|nr:homoserine dehydrogenase [Candidatus Bathyarchaeota archaeon]
MRIFMVGFGVVGRALAEKIVSEREELVSKFGLKPRIVAVADSSGALVDERGVDIERALEAKKRYRYLARAMPNNVVKTPLEELLENFDYDVLVETTPTNIVDGEPGLTYIKIALSMGKSVVTTNKGPLALALPALTEMADRNGAILRFSGTVGGGTPILDFGRMCQSGDEVVKVEGILNGTTNYVLTRMYSDGLDFDEALIEAQKAGYAEKDPSMDVEGFDTACKLVIIANYVMGLTVTLKDVEIRGIKGVTYGQLKELAKSGKTVKLLGTIDKEHGLLTVQSREVDLTDPLCVWGTLNAVTFHMEKLGSETIVGKGAGGAETAVAIVRDLIIVKRFLMDSLGGLPLKSL